MEVIEIQTLIDITKTKAVRANQGSQLEYNQNRNFLTLCQCVEIRSIMEYDSAPTVDTIDVKGLGFGSDYKGKHRVWTFRFRPDRMGVYVDESGNKVGCLLEDLDQVPVIKNLTETVNIDRAMFNCKDASSKNVVVRTITGSI